MTRQQRMYGTWSSPLSTAAVAADLRLNDVQWSSDAQPTLVWLEGRGKRGVLMAQSNDDAPRELTDATLSVSGRVGYGGGEFTVGDERVYFAANGRLYSQPLTGGSTRPITPAFGAAAAPRLSHDGKWLVYVFHYEGKDGLAVVDAEGRLWPAKLADDSDFVMQPVWSSDDTQLAYIAWNHPQMPWDGTQLRLAKLAYDSSGAPTLAATKTITGDEETAIFQPEFSPDGRYLAYISDAANAHNPQRFGQLWLYDLVTETHQMLTQMPAEHGAPAWVQGMRTFAWAADGKSIYALRSQMGITQLVQIAVKDGTTHPVDFAEPYQYLRQIALAANGEIALLASSPVIPERVVTLQPQIQRHSIRKRSSSESVLREQLSNPQSIEWRGHDGATVYGVYYPPASTSYTSSGAPPLIVDIHGGPTSQRMMRYEPNAQFFATRGYAVLFVNYRGSTGYGRHYQDKLRGAWGIYDVEDAASGALHLAEQGLADRSRLVIMGGSAGGFTVLQSLIDKPGLYRAGVCLFGVSNQFLLVQDTHKFEARYSDSLLGTLPDAAAVYRARSPIFHADKLSDPLIIFQGADDNVVPQNQSDSIAASLRARGIAHEYHIYEGEGHGWRKPETIDAFYQATLKFLLQHVIYN